MDVVIEANGFRLDPADRDALQRLGNQLEGAVRVEIALEARKGSLLGDLPDHFELTVRASTATNAVVEHVAPIVLLGQADGIFALLGELLERER